MSNKDGWGIEDNETSSRFNTKLTVLNSSFAEKNPQTTTTLSKHQLIYSIAGLILGLICIVSGMVLCLNGIVGSTNWTANILGAESQISDAAPGNILFFVGLFAIYISRYVFKVLKK